VSDPAPGEPVLIGRGLRKRFHGAGGEGVQALDDVSIEIPRGTLAALVGPDGAGKTTLIRLAAGLMACDSGDISVLGVNAKTDPQAVQDRIGYMPQKFGLYEDLTVQENLDLYADLHGISPEEREETYPRLMSMTQLGPFTARLAGRLSGGMKQKLGLACTLVRAPELLLLDEPTVGVDPLSRRELWSIIGALVRDQGLTVLLSTAYLDEAERCDHVVVLHAGKVLASGDPASVRALAEGRVVVATPPDGEPARVTQARLLDDPAVIDASPEAGKVRIVRRLAEPPAADAPEAETPPPEDPLAALSPEPVAARFEDGFMLLLDGEAPPRDAKTEPAPAPPTPPRRAPDREAAEPVIEVRDLVRRFGAFVAVDKVSFDVRRGEIFGLLGPNGAGKTTTFRMLCGLLQATSGTLTVAGADVRKSSAVARQKVGYVAQKFSLYGQLSTTENLDFFGRAYGLSGGRRRQRIAWGLAEFGLGPYADMLSGQLPGGYKQRLAMAAALLHEPQILFLDEATSGADPLARRDFWRRITALAEGGVTVVVTTHFMAEAEYCDRVAVLDSGRLLAQGSPAEIRERGRSDAHPHPTMEDAFVAIVEAARAAQPQEQAA
jgi:ABC-2 type transport system ATP-binding protein